MDDDTGRQRWVLMGLSDLSTVGNHKSADLQALRGVAILLVLVAHLELPELLFERAGFTNPGWIGVEFFFVISGFVVIQSFASSGFDVGRFGFARVFRLYPALLLMIGVSFAFNFVIPNITPEFAIPFF